nr:methylated-DNA--[protein]-cysteine S-methyltransferase [uncultured Cohaesibacter sp.]
MNEQRLHFCYHDSPIGPLLLQGNKRCLSGLIFPKGNDKAPANASWLEHPDDFSQTRRELDAYFAKRLERFTVPYSLTGSAFQLAVWRALCSIPYGSVTSYGDIAQKVGKPKGAQAVGMANHANPLPIIIPCHRVIGKDGSMVGFGGGLDLKRWLLEHEGITPGPICSAGQLGFDF